MNTKIGLFIGLPLTACSHPQVLRQLQQGLAKCHSVAFEKSGAVSDAKITPHTLNFVKKLVSTFGVGLENVSNVSTMFSSAASESLARRAQATAQDPVFQKMKGQFTTGQRIVSHTRAHTYPFICCLLQQQSDSLRGRIHQILNMQCSEEKKSQFFRNFPAPISLVLEINIITWLLSQTAQQPLLLISFLICYGGKFTFEQPFSPPYYVLHICMTCICFCQL